MWWILLYIYIVLSDRIKLIFYTYTYTECKSQTLYTHNTGVIALLFFLPALESHNWKDETPKPWKNTNPKHTKQYQILHKTDILQ
jgi:hypothetical protein